MRTDSWDTTRQLFAEQFEQGGTDFIYRKSQKGEAIKISSVERDRFIEEFDRNLHRAKWILYLGLPVVLGIFALLSVYSKTDVAQLAIFAGIGLLMIPYLAYFRWAWAAPVRALAGRMPIAGQRSPEEMRRLTFRRITYGQLAAAAFAGLVIPFFGSSRSHLFSGWNRLWLVFGGALILLAVVQAFRKWRFEQEDTYEDLARAAAPSVVDPSAADSAPRGNQVRRYLALVAIVGGSLVLFLTPAGKQLVQKPNFLPILMSGLGCWAFFTVGRGFTKGRIQPFVRGFSDTYQRETQPKRFWASMTWNALLGGFFVWIGSSTYRDAGDRAVQDHCYNQHNELSAQDSFDACTKLIEGRARLTYLSMADAYDYRAIANERLGERRRASADYTQAIRLDPTDDYAYLQRGLIFLDAMRLDQAVADFTRAHEIDPKSPWPLADRGMAYAWKNDRSRAEADFAAVRTVDHANIVVLHGQGVLDMNAGNLEAAVESFTAALRQDSSDAWSIQMRADAYQQMGEFEKARQDKRTLMLLSQAQGKAVAR